jgi:hypothetical protein
MAKKFTKTNLSFTLRAVLALILIWGNFSIAFAGVLGDSRPADTDTPPPTNTPAAATAPASDTKPQGMSSQNAREQYSSFPVGKYLTVGSDSPEKDKIGVQEQTYLKSENPVAAFIVQIINLVTLTAASLSFLAVVVGGFLMMTSAGNAGQVTKGKEILVRAVVGLVLTLSAYFMVAFVQNLLFETAGK